MTTLGIGLVLWQWREAVWARNRAEEQKEFADRQRDLAQRFLRQAESERTRAEEQKSLAERQKGRAEKQTALAEREKDRAESERVRADTQLRLASTFLAFQEWWSGNPSRSMKSLAVSPPGDRHWEWEYLDGMLQNHAQTIHAGAMGDIVPRVAFVDGGRKVVSGTQGGFVRIWNASTGSLIKQINTKGAGLAISSDGRRYAAATGGACTIWDLDSAKEIAKLTKDAGAEFIGGIASDAAFRPDGRQLAAGATNGVVYVWDVATGKVVHRLKGHPSPPLAVAMSPDGRRIASITPTQPLIFGASFQAGKAEVRIWDAETGALVASWSAPRRGTHRLAFSHDGTRLAAAGFDGVARVWEVSHGSEVAALRGHSGFVYCVAFSPDGRRLVSTGFDRTLRIWDLSTGRATLILRGHALPVFDAFFSPDGRRIVSGCLDGSVKVWDLPDPAWQEPDTRSEAPDATVADLSQEYLTLRGHDGAVGAIAFRPGGSEIATGGWDGMIRLSDSATGHTRLTFRNHGQPISSVAFDRDGSRVVSAAGGILGLGKGDVRIWDPDTGRERVVLNVGTNPVSVATFSPDGSRVVSAVGGMYWTGPGQVKLWDAATGRETASAPGPVKNVISLAYSPDGRRVATVGADPGIRLRDPGDGLKLVGTLGDDGWYRNVAYSHDGRLVAAASFSDPTIRVFDTASRRELGRLSGHGVAVHGLSFDASGARLASAGSDAAVKLWDLHTFQELLSLRHHNEEVYCVSFSPDGRLLASAGLDGAIRIRGLASASLPETDGWPVLFADDFNRSQIGDRWDTTDGRWSIDKGTLQGALVPTPNEPPRRRATASPRDVSLPSTVEIRFDFWTSAPLAFETRLLTATHAEEVLAQVHYPGGPAHPPARREDS